MKRLLLLPILLLISGITANAQEKGGFIVGAVNTADGKPAANVLIFIKGKNSIGYSTAKGRFKIFSPEGRQTVVFQTATKKQIETPVTVTANQNLEIPATRLAENAYELNEVVITGQYEPQSLRNSVYNVRTISSEMIRLRGATELKNILNTELGIRFSTDRPTGITNPELMGVSGAGIKILLDGVPMMDRGVERESLGQIDVNTIERIEIVEGPMSVIYGTDAMAGVINIITKRGGQDQFSVTARVQEETAGKEYDAFSGKGTHNEFLGFNWQKDGWHVAASGSRNNFGGWQGNKTGREQEWLPKDQLLTSAAAGYKNGKLDLWYRFNGADESLRLLGPISNSPKVSDKEYISKRWFHQLQGSLFVNNNLSIDAAAAYTDYSRRTLSTDLELATGKETLSTELGAQDLDELNTLFFRSTVQYKVSPEFTLQPGIEFNRNAGKGGRISGSPVINDYSFFLSSQWQINEAIQLKPGFRLTKNSGYSAPPIIPSLHTKIKLNEDFDLRLSYARGFRAPTLRELYFYMKDSNHDLRGNVDLKAEYSNSYHGSVSWAVKSTPDLRISSVVSAFFNDYKNKIDLGLLEGSTNVNTYLNIAKNKTTGGEWNNTLYWKGLQASLGFAYIGQYNRYAEDKENLGNTPKFVWSPELNSNISYLVPKINTNVSLFYKFSGERSAYVLSSTAEGTVARLSKVGAYHMADLTLNKTINKYLSVNGGVRNLLDVTRVRITGGETGAHTNDGNSSLGYGRSYFLGLTMNWAKK
ncbi:TonB-dependent receptor [Pedobacter gandavensis]|uniref:TonB-dependent receptor n=1 Tax=Pedobacter gandavensis TaxID=2679963 RepID=A0ABR6F2J8_9SPHI|nr:TonB-dependent receptor [Pedobacter gandavensis]MBB2151758.1 TonB-dependent receptor [Pedobacter gandavensis]